MKQKLKRFMAGFMAMLTLVGTLFTNGTTAFAASPQANIAFWNASVKNSGEVSELKPGFNHGKILYSILDGNSAYCMNFGLRADGGQLMNSYDDASTSMSAQQRRIVLTVYLLLCVAGGTAGKEKLRDSTEASWRGRGYRAGEGIKAGCAYEVFRGEFATWSKSSGSQAVQQMYERCRRYRPFHYHQCQLKTCIS